MKELENIEDILIAYHRQQSLMNPFRDILTDDSLIMKQVNSFLDKMSPFKRTRAMKKTMSNVDKFYTFLCGAVYVSAYSQYKKEPAQIANTVNYLMKFLIASTQIDKPFQLRFVSLGYASVDEVSPIGPEDMRAYTSDKEFLIHATTNCLDAIHPNRYRTQFCHAHLPISDDNFETVHLLMFCVPVYELDILRQTHFTLGVRKLWESWLEHNYRLQQQQLETT